MSIMKISDLSYLDQVENIELLQKGGFRNGTNLTATLSGDIVQFTGAVAQGVNVGGDQNTIAVAQGLIAVDVSNGNLGNDSDVTI